MENSESLWRDLSQRSFSSEMADKMIQQICWWKEFWLCASCSWSLHFHKILRNEENNMRTFQKWERIRITSWMIFSFLSPSAFSATINGNRLLKKRNKQMNFEKKKGSSTKMFLQEAIWFFHIKTFLLNLSQNLRSYVNHGKNLEEERRRERERERECFN